MLLVDVDEGVGPFGNSNLVGGWSSHISAILDETSSQLLLIDLPWVFSEAGKRIPPSPTYNIALLEISLLAKHKM